MFASLSRRRIGLLLAVTCLFMISLDRHDNTVISAARRALAVAVHPFEVAAGVVARPLERAWYGIVHAPEIERENIQLRDRLAAQAGAEVEQIAAYFETLQLKKVARMATIGSSKYVTTRVIGEAPSNFQNTIEIGVGAGSGIRVGMPVVDGAGLVGRILHVYDSSSVVLLITDPDFNIQAEVLQGPAPSRAAVPAKTNRTTTTTRKPGISTTTVKAAATPTSRRVTTTSRRATTTTRAAAFPVPKPSPTPTTKAIPTVRETGTLTGQTAGEPLRLLFLDLGATSRSVRAGAVVKTAGGSVSIAPAGLPIGVVSKVSLDSAGGDAVVEVRPNANLDQLTYVAVLLYVPQQSTLGS